MSAIVDLQGNPYPSTNKAYEGAARTARTANWSAPSVGPNQANHYSGRKLRDRARAGYRNSLLLKSAINKNTTNEVGRGFTLLSTHTDTALAATLNGLWRQLSAQLDPWADLNFAGLLHLAVKARRMSGEVFALRLRRPGQYGLPFGLQVELLEGDHCPFSLNRRLSKHRRIRQGIEFYKRQKVAYWFYDVHPDDDLTDIKLAKLTRVPARDVIHHYRPDRPGQIRGVPDSAAALLKDRTFADYDDAELVRKRERSAFTGFLYREDTGEDDWEFDPATGKPLHSDSQAYDSAETVRAGTMLRGVPGEKLDLFSGDDTGQGYKDYMRWQALQLAAGQDIPYALLTDDWAGLNDRLVRAFLNEYRRGIAFDQTNLSGFQFAFGIWRWFVDAAVLTGAIDAPGYSDNPWPYWALDIRTDAFKHLHPEQEINARNKAIRYNLSNAEAEAADHGQDLDNNMRRNAKALKRWKEICDEEGVEHNTGVGGLFTPSDTTGDSGE